MLEAATAKGKLLNGAVVQVKMGVASLSKRLKGVVPNNFPNSSTPSNNHLLNASLIMLCSIVLSSIVSCCFLF